MAPASRRRYRPRPRTFAEFRYDSFLLRGDKNLLWSRKLKSLLRPLLPERAKLFEAQHHRLLPRLRGLSGQLPRVGWEVRLLLRNDLVLNGNWLSVDSNFHLRTLLTSFVSLYDFVSFHFRSNW